MNKPPNTGRKKENDRGEPKDEEAGVAERDVGGSWVHELKPLHESIRSLAQSVQEIEKLTAGLLVALEVLDQVRRSDLLRRAGEALLASDVPPVERLKRLAAMLERVDAKKIQAVLESPHLQALLDLMDPKKPGGK
ncbi:MAG: hypothetical protein BLITH_0692 [Brockia lithotrophica]|uniref:Uncharacterized protein n=1 Tax=Brockia lithotrophica TaxID=933949 RepID=A0A2T5G8K2_9BACL|nr:MAG: hypothetical protein BLITH_0692 [Brockia lithotrophica]